MNNPGVYAMTPKKKKAAVPARKSIRGLPTKKQIDRMRSWFFAKFEDPAQHTPYESAEGGYIWIHGGPYDARDELENEFGDEARAGAIEDLVDELSNECWEWAGVPQPEDYDYTAPDLKIRKGDSSFETLNKRIHLIETMIPFSDKLNAEQAGLQRQMLFSSCITALETYISECFTKEISNDKVKTKRLFEVDDGLKKLSVHYRDLFDPRFNPKRLVLDYLENTSFHNLPKVRSLYKSVLEKDLGDISSLKVAIDKRHDLIHRAGKTKTGKRVKTSDKEIQELAFAIRGFCDAMERGKPYIENPPVDF